MSTQFVSPLSGIPSLSKHCKTATFYASVICPETSKQTWPQKCQIKSNNEATVDIIKFPAFILDCVVAVTSSNPAPQLTFSSKMMKTTHSLSAVTTIFFFTCSCFALYCLCHWSFLWPNTSVCNGSLAVHWPHWTPPTELATLSTLLSSYSEMNTSHCLTISCHIFIVLPQT